MIRQKGVRMKVLITGAGGNLGRVLAPALAENGYQPVLMDYRPLDTPYRFVQGDVTRPEDVMAAVSGVDVIVHAAALHGIHLEKYSRDDYWNLNVAGTYSIYEAARKQDVKKILLCSTMGVYGESIVGTEDSFAVVTEDLPLLPRDFYGQTKKLCEDLAAFYSRNHTVQTIAYRLGMFVPENFIRYGFRLLKGGVDDRDVAQAFLLGLANDEITFDAFNIMAEVPFTADEFSAWKRDPGALLERHFPGIAEHVQARGEDIHELGGMWGSTYWSIDKAEQVLGYAPKHNFPEFYEALKQGSDDYYPFANLPWWGV
jgi:nucleoside-diphosphate-sugar epimerase